MCLLCHSILQPCLYGESKTVFKLSASVPCRVCICGTHANISANQVRPGSNTACSLRPVQLQQFSFDTQITVSLHQKGCNSLTTELLQLPRSWQIHRLLYKATSGCAWMYAPIKYTCVDRHALNQGDTAEHKMYNPQWGCITHGLCLLWI